MERAGEVGAVEGCEPASVLAVVRAAGDRGSAGTGAAEACAAPDGTEDRAA